LKGLSFKMTNLSKSEILKLIKDHSQCNIDLYYGNIRQIGQHFRSVEAGIDLEEFLCGKAKILFLSAVYCDLLSDSRIEHHATYVRFRHEIFLNLVNLKFVSMLEIIQAFHGYLDVPLGVPSAETSRWKGNISYELLPSIEDYFKTIDVIKSSDILNDKFLKYWTGLHCRNSSGI
jgi:hypothetical protein